MHQSVSDLVQLILLYAVIHIICLLFWNGFEASVAGMFIDLRYILYFALVYATLKLFPQYRQYFIRVGFAGAVVVLLFAVLQVFVLPHDILRHIGYSAQTITPYLTVDLNYDFVRINSTLRGPNPLGAYAGIVLAIIAAAVVRGKLTPDKKRIGIALLLTLAAAVALWASYSRSAAGAAVIMIAIVLVIGLHHLLSRRVWIVSAIVAFALLGGLFAIRDSSFVSNVILHENPNGGSVEKSNDGHVDSLYDGTARMVRQPFGAGIGSTGSASLGTDQPLIIENQYLFIAHETGWAGLAVFVGLFGLILRRLWYRRSDWLALGAFASGIGLAAIGLLLPVWVDDTVSVIWWGLAAVALTGGVYGKRTRK
ncbi:MAG: hypothetical protein EOO17_03795 [Chloroflexi bacterium]|nr:MAG: hypothetical protein EOO17_03795 [Chloroflexota bacterium]